MKTVVDMYCGAGGTSCGAESTGEARVVFAVNHWDVAIRTHSANFPNATHAHARIDQVKPGESPRMDILFASPECTHYSRARGGRPTSEEAKAELVETVVDMLEQMLQRLKYGGKPE